MNTTAIKVVTISLILFFCVNNSMADDYNVRLSANQYALDSEFEAVINTSNSIVMTGISGVYDNDDYKILFLKALIGNEILIDGFTGGLGFKGAWGEAEKRNIDGDILNLGFTGYAGYDLSKTSLNNYPVILSSSLFFSPEPLSFGDTKKFIEILAECSWKVLDQAALILSYRYFEIDFTNRTKWEKSESAGYLGLKFFF
ncbi:MAG: hypothetical protein HF978_13180 [Desulfobacteraceae bacterium]|nr:hypothetical protein [Desulfobacteraceae bacterium]MBC2756494.1 hypothetical protein [Desulfobacteraceae bacterium]